jgi:hypothetical protein
MPCERKTMVVSDATSCARQTAKRGHSELQSMWNAGSLRSTNMRMIPAVSLEEYSISDCSLPRSPYQRPL